MPYPTSARILLPLLLLVPKVAYAAREFSSWEDFDLDHPVCERPIALGIGKESFFEVANDVAGKREYNQLIRLFRDRKWSELEHGITTFRTTFESSPLREAVTFLEVQSLFDQDTTGVEDEDGRRAERKLRGALLLYPKSDFAPVLTATAGAHWLRTGNYQRSLAIYETGVNTFTQDPLYCTFLMGVAETQFLLRKWDVAEAAYDRVMATCVNFRLRAAALIRKVDLKWQQGKSGVVEGYEKLVADESPFIERFYQPTLANLGELLYRAGKWKEAGYFFDRYTTTERSQSDCMPYVAKRQADLAARMGDKPGKVTGRYLAVYDKFPKTDMGRFAYAHGLLTDPQLKPGGELDRRIRLVDAEVDSIGNEDLRSRIYVEKGLTLLDLGKIEAVNYLNNLRGKTRFVIDKGKTGDFIRHKLIGLLEAGKLAELDSPAIEKAIESVYSDWLKGTPSATWAVEFYAKIAGDSYAALVDKGELDAGLELLHRWQASPLWSPQGPPKAVRLKIGYHTLRALYLGGADSPLVLKVGQSRSILDSVVAPEYAILGWFAETLLQAKGSRDAREPASQVGALPSDQVTLYRLATAQGLRLSGDAKSAQGLLQTLDDPKWNSSILLERIELAKALGDGPRAFNLVKRRLTGADAATQKKLVAEMSEIVDTMKVWNMGGELLQTARATFSEPKDLGPYYHLAARALYESRQCKQAIPLFENAFKMTPDAPQAAGSHFRLGKCWLAEKKPEAARQEWSKAVQLKDSFWSPLAQSEMKLLAP